MTHYHQDHLGNTCAVWDATHDSIVQQTLYYASGLPVSVSTGQDVQPYKYNGKEYVEMHGLDEYDSEARWYYPAICRTTTMDPLAEKYYSTSPYAWCGNNPVNYIDPLGLDTIRVTYKNNQWEISSIVVAEGDDVIIVIDEDGNDETYTYKEGEYGKRIIMLTLSYGGTKNDESFGVYHVSGAKENGTGFYVTRGGNSLEKNSGEGVPEGDYPILAPSSTADWQQVGLGGKIVLRGIRIHPGTSYKWSGGCYILFTDYKYSNEMTIFDLSNSREAVKKLNILLGADPNRADYQYQSRKNGNNRYGAYFPNEIKDIRLIQKYRK